MGEDNNDEMLTTPNSTASEIDAVGLIGGRLRGLSKAESKVPEPLSIESVDEDATDFFSLSGSNLKTDRSSVTCTRQSNGNSAHSAFGTQLVARGRIEWMIKIESGHSIRIGVCGSTDSVDRLFTETKYGYGSGDDGNIYFGGSHIEYNDGFKAGDIIGVYLNMDMNTLKFSVNGADHGAAFDSIDLDDKDEINGYRLAVSLQHRPHKLTLLESTLYNVERRSPRPNNNTFGNGGGHQRKLSYTTMSNKRKGTASSTISSDDAKSDEHLTPKPVAAKSPSKKKKKSSKKSDPLDSNLSPSKIKKKGKGKKKKSISDKDGTTVSSKKAKGKKKKSKTTATSTVSKKKSKKAKTATTS